MSPALALQRAMRDRLLAHAPLLALLGGAHVFDERPRGAQPPFVAFGQIETRDWSTCEATGHEHLVTLDIACRTRSRAHADEIASEIELALDRASLTLDGHVLVNLVLRDWTLQRRGDAFTGSVRFRAVTEPLT